MFVRVARAWFNEKMMTEPSRVPWHIQTIREQIQGAVTIIKDANVITNGHTFADWAGDFLAALAILGNVTQAAFYAGVSRKQVYRHRAKRVRFRESWDEAMAMAADLLEAEARRRAVEGVPHEIYRDGKLVSIQRKYSDTLLIFLLKGNKPEKFADRQQIKHEGVIVTAQVADIRSAMMAKAEALLREVTPDDE